MLIYEYSTISLKGENLMNASELILDDIKKYMVDELKINVLTAEQIDRGLLNLKWSVKTTNGNSFVKQYSKERYNKLKINKIRERLRIQMLLHDEGVLCPNIYKKNGRLIHTTINCEDFIITSLIEGKIIEYGYLSEKQSRHLGECVGRMHYILNEKIKLKGSSSWELPTKARLLEEWDKLYSYQNLDENLGLKRILLNQKELIENMDMKDFQNCKKGWAHSDLWAHNLLFKEDELTGFLDFDRLSITYPELDTARVLLSLALRDNELDRSIVNGFIEGYSKYYNISIEDINRSFKLLWCLESFWWFREQYFDSNNPANRMMYEMIWVMENWNKIIINEK